jgi:hypothetical protein
VGVLEPFCKGCLLLCRCGHVGKRCQLVGSVVAARGGPKGNRKIPLLFSHAKLAITALIRVVATKTTE